MLQDISHRESLIRQIYGINERSFETVALDLWSYQYKCNPLYRTFCKALGVDEVQAISKIPFLPVTMFRDHDIQSAEWQSQTTFKSSGTTGSIPSRHLIRDLAWYHKIAGLCFESFYEKPDNYTWLALLPSYLERPDSSLVDMVQYFMQMSAAKENGFYSRPDEKLVIQLEQLYKNGRPTILIGVSFALLDLLEQYKIPVWDQLLVIETGGMKGRREEMTRDELHDRFRTNHPKIQIASEYGMTELISQAYSQQHLFSPGPTMKVLIRDISDPLKIVEPGQRGIINVIDLGNIDTCAFIATEDVGIGYEDGKFEVLGRLDQSDIRGCNLMYQ
ncbi:MAG TPA: acyl transferase [Saprospiraceae bacterium]|nr:acyl transferase [Saprospiraceae bacterium]